MMCPSASFNVIPFRFFKYITTTVGDLDMLATQCTRILLLSLFGATVPSITLQAVPAMLQREDEPLSLIGRLR